MTEVKITLDGVEYNLVPTPSGTNSCEVCLMKRWCFFFDGKLCQLAERHGEEKHFI